LNLINHGFTRINTDEEKLKVKGKRGKRKDTMSEISRITMVNEYWRYSEYAKREEMSRMERGFQFYIGNQWEPSDLAKLYAEKRPALTINLILPILNLLSGIQRQSREEITVTARKGGLKKLAQAYTKVLRHCLDMTDGDYEIADCFLDGIIGNKGWLSIGIDYDKDPIHGDLVIQKVSPFDIREDPDAREYDLNKSGRYVIRDRWMDKEALRLNYPDKEADLSGGGLESDPALGDRIGDPASPDSGSLRWRVRECWWKRFEKRWLLINASSGEMKTISAQQRELACALSKKSVKWHMKEWVVPVLCKTVTVGNLVLEDIEDPYNGVTAFPYYRFCPYWIDGYVMGVTQNLIGPQQEVNKRRSQALHNLNQSANSGYVIKKALNHYDRHLAKFGSTPGVVLDESKAGGKIERIQPAPISDGHITAARMSGDDMKEISGVNFDLLGQLIEGHNESGKAIELRQAQGMKVVEVIFDNFARTQKLIALGLVDMVRFTDVYSDQEIRDLAAEQGEPVDIALLKSRKVGKYGIKVQSSSSSPTARYANFMSILEIARMYPDQIGPKAVIELSDIPKKELILQEIKDNPAEEMIRPRKPSGIQTKKVNTSREDINFISS